MSELISYDFKSEAEVRPAAILTNSYVASTVIETKNWHNQLIVYINFTKGSLTNAIWKVEFSNDNVTYFDQTDASLSAGVSTDLPITHIYTADAKARVPIAIKDKYIRISIIGTGTVTASSAAISAVLGTT